MNEGGWETIDCLPVGSLTRRFVIRRTSTAEVVIARGDEFVNKNAINDLIDVLLIWFYLRRETRGI